MPKTPNYKQIKAVRQSTFRTGEAPTHIIGLNKATGLWEVIKSLTFANYAQAKQWAYHYAHEHFPKATYIWMGCVSDEEIRQAFAKNQTSTS